MTFLISYKKRIWDLLISLCATLLAIYVPLQTVLKIPDTIQYTSIYWLITLIFIADIGVNYFSEPADHHNIVQSKKHKTNYLKTWFIVDLLAAIPFEIIFANPVFGLIRLVKFLKVAVYIHDLRQRILKLQDYSLLIFFAFWVLIISHWLTCGWISLRIFPEAIENAEKYVASIFWVIETLTTVGYGEIVPSTMGQQIYAILVMLFGVAMYGFIIGNVANILSKRNPARAQYFNNLEQLRVFVDYRSIPLNLQKKIMDYYLYIWRKKLGFDESVFLSGLPQGLQSEVSVFLKREILEKIPIFRGVSNSFLFEVSSHMRPQVCIPGETIFEEGDIGNEMFFVIRGNLHVYNGDKKISTIKDGDFFGEIALFTENKKRTASVLSNTYCDLYRLDKDHFLEVLDKYPEIAAHIKSVANQRIESDSTENI
jgi:Ion transport protein/Cyclic nucleotide-binding domain